MNSISWYISLHEVTAKWVKLLSLCLVRCTDEDSTRKKTVFIDNVRHFKSSKRAKVVVLSCCHSGRGRVRAEGVVEIARAFSGSALFLPALTAPKVILGSLYSLYQSDWCTYSGKSWIWSGCLKRMPEMHFTSTLCRRGSDLWADLSGNWP